MKTKSKKTLEVTQMKIKPKKKPPSERQKYTCADCPGKIYLTKCGLRQHIDSSHFHKKPYQCSKCEKSFTSSTKLRCHLKIHDQIKDFSCEYPDCGKKFITKDQVKSHIEFIHLKLKPFPCNLCGKYFSQKKKMILHSVLHTMPVKKCKFCDQAFLTKRDQQQHQNSAHPLRRCIVCEKDLHYHHQVKNHLKTKNHRDAVILYQAIWPHMKDVNDFIIAV